MSEANESADSLTPESGVRVRLDLKEQSGERARYRVTLFFADGEESFDAEVPAEGATSAPECASPPYALKACHACLRQTQSAHRTTGRWPRRVLRWRAEK